MLKSFCIQRAPLCVLAVSALMATGCQDGPLYALKVANPFYVREWKNDAAFGVTDHERRTQLALLAETIHTMPENKRQFWSNHLSQLIENDESPEMRRLAVQAAGRLNDESAMAMIHRGLDDDSIKVRMEACRALGRRDDSNSSTVLASVIGTETSDDVKHSALEALGNHRNETSVRALQLALSDRDPATQLVAVNALKGATGKNYGDNPQVWIAALEGKPVEEQNPTRIADRVREISPF